MTKTQDDDVQFTTMTTTDEGHDHESRPRPQQRQQNDGNNNSYYYNYNYDNYSYNCKQRHQCIDMLLPTFCFFFVGMRKSPLLLYHLRYWPF